MLGFITSVTLLAASVVATPIPVYEPPCQGCGKTQTPGYDSTPRTIESGGYTRSFTIQVPSDYDAHDSHPLILDFVCLAPFSSIRSSSLIPHCQIFLILPSSYYPDPSSTHHPFHNVCSLTLFQHGRGGTSATQRDNSLYHNYTASSDYIIVYPQGIACDHGTAWQGASYACPDVNDIDFVSDLLNYLEDNFCIDTSRVYASGKSNGAGFTNTIAQSDLGDRFAAFAMASAALYTDTSLESSDKKRAILEAHGEADKTIPYAGGDSLGGPVPDIGQWVSWWGERDCGAGGAMVSIEKMDGYEFETISCSGGLSDVVSHYHLNAPAAHCWPNAQGDNYDALKTPQGCGDSRSLDFTAVVLEWFARWNLENAP